MIIGLNMLNGAGERLLKTSTTNVPITPVCRMKIKEYYSILDDKAKYPPHYGFSPDYSTVCVVVHGVNWKNNGHSISVGIIYVL